ncbi:MAG TPA: sulfite exporter TauE/SafE family protein, partial [Bacteroidia bacterium]|nr:sulfite exporter TauE/SafE family protein [Bacteroidia bacterium]
TGIVIACMVDVSRLAIYGSNHFGITQNEISIVAAGTLSAFAGAYLGNKLVKKVTLKSIQLFVTVMLIVFAIALGAGII